MKKIKLTLDNEKIELNPGTTILEAANSKGIFIPTFCYIKELKPVASCSICVVEVEGEEDLVPSCSTQANDGMIVRTSTEIVKEARRSCIELLLSDHLGDCMGPCTSGCPAGIDISGFIKYISFGENRKALKLIKQNMPFPGILGRICKKPCEDVCRRQLVEEPVAICYLKRFAADVVSGSGNEYIPDTASSTGKKVAIVGAGPAGLTTAYYLQILGHKCTIFDENKMPGGMLRYGIPGYRLPVEVIDNEIDVIKKIGVKFLCNKKLGTNITLGQLQQDYDAVFLGLGAQKPFSIGIDGEGLKGVVSGIVFLHSSISTEKKKNLSGQKIIVIGGGDVAMDAARVAVRKGAENVYLYCLEKLEEMPAGKEEVEAAALEGIKIHNEWGVKRILNKDGNLSGVEFKKCTSVFDEKKRFNPKYKESETIKNTCDTLILSVGQKVDASMAEGVIQTPRGLIAADEKTFQTNIENVFAGGDCVSGADTAVNAVSAGRKAAISIDQFIKGEKIIGEPFAYNHTMDNLEDIPKKAVERFTREQRISMPFLSPEKRKSGFDEIEKGFHVQMAREEAKRCMECRCRDAHECRLRTYATMFYADRNQLGINSRKYNLDNSHPDIIYEEHKCIKCSLCVRITEELLGTRAMQVVGRGYSVEIKPSPAGRMEFVDSTGLEKIVQNCPVGALTFKKDIVPVGDYIFRQE